MKYDTTGMDVAYVQSLYPNESPEVIIKAMLFVRENGYPKKIGIIAWFDFILHIMRDIVRLHATKYKILSKKFNLASFEGEKRKGVDQH